MRLGQLIRLLTDRLEEGRDTGVTEESPVIVEGHNEDDLFVQGSIETVKTERRCEADGEPSGVYLDLHELSIE